ncbi:MAG: hypothetical protein P4L27_00415 [Ignavibacteriaceae bacterium]|nr:hypothetical protein [Ignavibacteriaceae bacterium]
MKELSDDILNKYIDGELSRDEVKEAEGIIMNSKEVIIRLNALREADRSLRNLSIIETRSNFTSIIMKRIEHSIRSRKEQKKFIITVVSVFIILCIGIVGIAGFTMMKNFNPGTSTVVKDSIKYMVSASELISNIINSMNISIVGAIFSLGVIISAWFFFDYSKELRKAEK